ncbi:hypothetical protein HAX54_002157 [Datura stramonium]|uniref:Uncharacterized protein n=1 Tax=Datura stramonium TaxID=4076 RepID=A0ABS8T457_DATST|nr:hypothetical protein [Datura stramonium]
MGWNPRRLQNPGSGGLMTCMKMNKLCSKLEYFLLNKSQLPSRDPVRPPSTKSGSKKIMEDALKKSQDKNIRRRKLKKRIIMEEEVQPKNILDLKRFIQKEIDEDVAGET